MSTKDRLGGIGKAVFFVWYVPNVVWNLYTLAHADPTRLTDGKAVVGALVLPWPFSNPEVPAWIDVFFFLVLAIIFLWLSNNLSFLLQLIQLLGIFFLKTYYSCSARIQKREENTIMSYYIPKGAEKMLLDAVGVILALLPMAFGTISWCFIMIGNNLPEWDIITTCAIWIGFTLLGFLTDDADRNSTWGYIGSFFLWLGVIAFFIVLGDVPAFLIALVHSLI
jgi:hypothetical protein